MTTYGTRYEVEDGRLVRVVDRTGVEWAWLAWISGSFASLDVPGACVLDQLTRDELLGDAHEIISTGTAPPVVLTRVSAIDWARPTEIPAIAAPGRLPAGSGGAILNAIAILARHAGVAALRYAGPYPTPALWRTLARSFRTTGTEADFTANLVDRMTRLARDPIAIDFAPAPHEQVAIADRLDRRRGHVELRDGVQRVVIDSVAYERGGSPARIVDDGDTIGAELWFGDVRYARIAMVSPDSTLLDGPHDVPRCESDVIGKLFPPALTAALAELVADAVPALLARDARAWLATREIRWADLGARVARIAGDRVEVHAALWLHVGPYGLGRLALALAEALVPVVTNAVVAEIVARGRLPA